MPARTGAFPGCTGCSVKVAAAPQRALVETTRCLPSASSLSRRRLGAHTGHRRKVVARAISTSVQILFSFKITYFVRLNEKTEAGRLKRVAPTNQITILVLRLNIFNQMSQTPECHTGFLAGIIIVCGCLGSLDLSRDACHCKPSFPKFSLLSR